MSFLITDFRTRMRYRLRDSEAPYRYSEELIDAWGNAALVDITIQAPHISANVDISGDGAAYQFDLSEQTRFMLLRRLSLAGATGHPIIEHASGIEYIRIKETGGGIIAGDPTCCVVDNHNMLNLDAIIAATDVLKLAYWQTPKTWVETVADLNTESLYPDGLLAIGFDDLILAMTCIKAGSDLGETFGNNLVQKYYPIVFGDKASGLIGQLERFKSFVAKTSHGGHKQGIRYSDLGVDPTVYGMLGR